MQEAKPWTSSLKIISLLFIVSLIILLFFTIGFFASKQLKLELASHKFAVKRKIVLYTIIFSFVLETLWVFFVLGGTRTDPKLTNFGQLGMVCFLFIFLALIINLLFYMLGNFFTSAGELAKMFQTKTYSFQRKTFQLIGKGKITFSHWKIEGNLVLQDEKKNIIDLNFVCLAPDSELNKLRGLLKEVKICPRQKLNWRDWLLVAIVFISISFIFLVVLFLASLNNIIL